MNSAILWIFFPALIGLGIYFIARKIRLSISLGAVVLFALAFLAWKLPIDQTIKLGPWSFQVAGSFEILGRHLVLGTESRALLVLFYVMAGFWFVGALAAGVNRFFAPVGLVMVALFIAALAVDPFLYAALFIELAVLASIPMLSPPGEVFREGVTRYLIYQVLAMPFILFTGWMLTGVEAGNADISIPLRAGILLGLGFALLLAVFPFHSWIPLITEQNHPYAAGFVFFMLQTAVLLFGAAFLNQYNWLRASGELYDILRLTGALMVVTGGLMAAFQSHLGRMMGYAVTFETGFSLLALSLGGKQSIEIFSMLLLPRAISMTLWALSLAILSRQSGSLRLDHLNGAGRKYPLTTAGLMLGQLSIVGLPLLAGFPAKLALLESVAIRNPIVVLWAMLGMIGLLIGGLRSLAVLVIGQEWGGDPGIAWKPKLLIGLGILAVLWTGFQPQLYMPWVINLMNSFPHLL